MSPLFNSVDLAAVRKNRSLTLMELAMQDLSCPASLIRVTKCYVLLHQNWHANPPYRSINRTNKSLNALVDQVNILTWTTTQIRTKARPRTLAKSRSFASG